jgi:hypothetical protein
LIMLSHTFFSMCMTSKLHQTIKSIQYGSKNQKGLLSKKTNGSSSLHL